VNNKVVIATLAALVACVVLVAAYVVITDKEETGGEKPRLTEEELLASGVTLYKEDMRIVLHDVATLDGVPFGSGDIPKKYVLLTFWASWCPDCVLENPSLQRLYDKRESDTFTVLTISIDTSQDALETYLQNYGYDFPVLINAKNNLWQDYFSVIPTSFLLSPDGHVIAKMVDYMDWDGEEAQRILDYLISMP
jgi:thiol-disulfide isomerase/thioredoxin